MGLDIYLYRCDDWKAAIAAEDGYEKATDAVWEEVCAGRKYEELTEAEKDAVRKRSDALKTKFGLADYHSNLREKIEIDSALDPEHYCKVGYLRSSYNGSGFNSVTRNLLGKEGFYYIFDHERGDEDFVVPDWAKAKARAEEVAGDLEREIADGNAVRVMHVGPNMFGPPPTLDSEQKAMEIYRAERKKQRHPDTQWYSNLNGEFFLGAEPMKVRAIIPGINELLGRVMPCVYVVYESETDWYVKAARIAAETCAYVLAHPKPETFRFSWSS